RHDRREEHEVRDLDDRGRARDDRQLDPDPLDDRLPDVGRLPGTIRGQVPARKRPCGKDFRGSVEPQAIRRDGGDSADPVGVTSMQPEPPPAPSRSRITPWSCTPRHPTHSCPGKASGTPKAWATCPPTAAKPGSPVEPPF